MELATQCDQTRAPWSVFLLLGRLLAGCGGVIRESGRVELNREWDSRVAARLSGLRSSLRGTFVPLGPGASVTCLYFFDRRKRKCSLSVVGLMFASGSQ